MRCFIFCLSVMQPSVIRRQMMLQQFTMLKFFLSALATSEFLSLYIYNTCMNLYVMESNFSLIKSNCGIPRIVDQDRDKYSGYISN